MFSNFSELFTEEMEDTLELYATRPCRSRRRNWLNIFGRSLIAADGYQPLLCSPHEQADEELEAPLIGQLTRCNGQGLCGVNASAATGHPLNQLNL
jgi:hypothetical protein